MQGEVVVYLLLLHSNLINIPAALDVSTTGWHKYMYIALFCFSQIFNLYFWRKKSSGPQLPHIVCHTCSNTLGSNFKTLKFLKIIQVLHALMLINCISIKITYCTTIFYTVISNVLLKLIWGQLVQTY